ncbi:MAG: hypothetical protein IJB01_10010 [Bacteroidaceae bacterium]|nr:hypothetical protein [Bacteroidaceae bacterium]
MKKMFFLLFMIMAPVAISAQRYVSDCDSCDIVYGDWYGTCRCGGLLTCAEQKFDEYSNLIVEKFKCDKCDHIHTFKRVKSTQNNSPQKNVPSKPSKPKEHKCTSICFVEQHEWIQLGDSVVELNLRIINTCKANKTIIYLIDGKDYTEPVKPGGSVDYKKRFKERKDITIAPTRLNTKAVKGKLTKRPSKN